MAAPTAAELKAYILGRFKITIDDTHPSVAQTITAAVGVLERVSGYSPFLAGDTATSKRIKFASKVGVLPNGALGTITVSANGTTYALGTAYDIGPVSGDPPTQWIEWLGYTLPTVAITVNARWGYADDYPADVFHALKRHAASQILDQISSGQAAVSGLSWSDGDVSQTNAAGKLTQTRAGDLAGAGAVELDQALATFQSYRRVEVYF